MSGLPRGVFAARRRAAAGRGADTGYAMLGALAATALGMAVALAAFAMADVAAQVTGRDAAAERARGAAEGGVTEAVEWLVWGGLPSLWNGAAGEVFERRYGDGSRTTVAVSATAVTGEPRDFSVRADGRSGSATAAVEELLRLEPDRYPVGLTVAEDLLVGARLTLDGVPAHVGGDVHGSENVVSGEVTGEANAWLVGEPDGWPPAREWLVCLRAHASGGLLAGDETSVDLVALAEAVALLPASAPLTGPVIFVRPAGGELALRGWWPLVDDQPQLTLVVDGDVHLGRPCLDGAGPLVSVEESVAFRGALLATGTITVESTSVVVGFLAARRLDVRAALTVILSGDWRGSPPPGSLRLLRRSEGRRTETTGERRPAGRRSAVLTPSSWIVNMGRTHVVRGLSPRIRSSVTGSEADSSKAVLDTCRRMRWRAEGAESPGCLRRARRA